jgi:hypothetical protein
MKHNSNSGVFLYASKHIFLEQIDSHHNAGPGFFANDGAADGGGHIFLNCDAHDNYDPLGWQGDGENASLRDRYRPCREASPDASALRLR